MPKLTAYRTTTEAARMAGRLTDKERQERKEARKRERERMAEARKESARRWKAAFEQWGPPQGREQKNELGRALRLKDKLIRGKVSDPIRRTSTTRCPALMEHFLRLREALSLLEEDRTNRELGSKARKHIRAIAAGMALIVKPLDRRGLELGGRVSVPPEKGKARRRQGVLKDFDGERATVTVKGVPEKLRLKDVRKAR